MAFQNFLRCPRRPSPGILRSSDSPWRPRMRETFLFVGTDPDFAATLFATLEAAGKFVIRAHSVEDALEDATNSG